jgi:hypothetical protein
MWPWVRGVEIGNGKERTEKKITERKYHMLVGLDMTHTTHKNSAISVEGAHEA